MQKKKMKDQIDQFYKTIGDHKANVGNYPVGAQLLGDLASRAGLGGLVSSGLVGFQAAGAIGAVSAAGAAAVAALESFYRKQRDRYHTR